MAEVGEYVQAIYAFAGDTASDLGLEVGDVVKVTDIVDDDWATGTKVGGHPENSGNFPVSFVERLILPSVRTDQKIFVAIQDFPADQVGDLDFAKGFCFNFIIFNTSYIGF